VDPAFLAAIMADGLQPGQILAPVKSAFAWHVIQIMRTSATTEATFLTSLKTKITDEASFRQAAKDNSEGAGAADGGDIGWVAKGQLDPNLERAIFATPIGQMSDVTDVASDGTYLYWVLGEETRTPTADQLNVFKTNGFDTWYNAKKGAADIKYLIGTSATG
jgi:parvulin-like peptidyl-prolyl isomerase